MRILYIITRPFRANYPRDQNYILKYMTERNHDVTLVSSYERHAGNLDSIIYPKAKILRFLSLKARRQYFFISPAAFQKIFREKYDIVHTFTFFTFSSVLGALAKFSRNATSSIIRSEVGPPYVGENFKKACMLKPFFSLITNNYDLITAYNEFEAKSLRLLGISNEKIYKLPPMIDFNKFSKLSKDKQDAKIINLGTISRLCPSKGIHHLIPLLRYAYKMISDRFQFTLAGEIEDKLYASRILIELRKILHEKFKYLGEVASPIIFYKSVDIVIVPTFQETGAISVLEAMAAGKIILARNIYPINLYIKDSFNGFLFNNVEEAKKKLLFIFDNLESLDYMKFNASETAKKYDYKDIGKHLEREYNRLIGV